MPLNRTVWLYRFTCIFHRERSLYRTNQYWLCPTVYGSINHCYQYASNAARQQPGKLSFRIDSLAATPVRTSCPVQCSDKQFAMKRRIAGRATCAIVYSRHFDTIKRQHTRRIGVKEYLSQSVMLYSF